MRRPLRRKVVQYGILIGILLAGWLVGRNLLETAHWRSYVAVVVAAWACQYSLFEVRQAHQERRLREQQSAPSKSTKGGWLRWLLPPLRARRTSQIDNETPTNEWMSNPMMQGAPAKGNRKTKQWSTRS